VVPIRTRRFTNERLVVLVALGLATAVCLALEQLRERHFGATDFRYLLWNLFLAWIPLVLALTLYDRYRRGTTLSRLAPIAALWLVFLPNAPYIVTDFVHLAPAPRTPLWLDGATLAAFAGSGLLLGFVSLYLVHAVVRSRSGARAGWATVLLVLGLASAGVWIGRILRWNSWDVLVRPGRRLSELLPHLADPAAVAHAGAVTLLLTGALAATYLVFYALVGLRLELRPGSPGRDR
jgi:uncharacterized membrane protein